MFSKNGLWYKKYGSGKPIFFLHGLPLDLRVWNTQKYKFHGFTTYLIDIPGMGKSKKLSEKINSMEAISKIISEFAKELKLKKVVLLGHSMGGYVALDFALRFPNLVSGLILVSTKASPDDKAKKQGRIKFAKQILAGKHDEYFSNQLKACAEPSSSYFIKLKHVISQNITWSIVPILEALANRPSYIPNLHEIKIPCHIIVGDNDRTMKDESFKMNQLINMSSFAIIKNSAHMVFLDQPTLFKNSMSLFLKNLN